MFLVYVCQANVRYTTANYTMDIANALNCSIIILLSHEIVVGVDFPKKKKSVTRSNSLLQFGANLHCMKQIKNSTE